MIGRAAVFLATLLVAVPAAQAELPEVEAAAANLSVYRPPPREQAPDLTVTDRHGRTRTAANRTAGVPGMRVTVTFPPDSAQLDKAQALALYKLTREWRFTPGVQLLWVRAGGDAPLARKRAEALRRATGGKGFPWKRIWLDPTWECEGELCDRQGTITVIERR